MDSFKDLLEATSLSLLAEVLVKLGIGAALGAAIGYEREKSGRPAGIRTHMLLVIGVVLFSEVSKHFGTGGDQGRIAAQIVTGVGFLGAGTIMRLGIEIKGLTSAASLWAAAAIGMAVSAGGGMILVAVAATALTLLTLACVTFIEQRLVPKHSVCILHSELEGRQYLPALMESVQNAGGTTRGMRVVSSYPLHVELDVEGDKAKLLEAVAGTEGVKASDWVD